jgi:hypothetical protein
LCDEAAEWIGYYHILPATRNSKLQAESGIISLDANSHLATNISEAGQYQCLFIGKFGCVYQEVEFDGSPTLHQVHISKPTDVAIDLNGLGFQDQPVVAIPKRVPMIICWALCRRFAGMESGAFPMHVMRRCKCTLPAQPGDAAVDAVRFWRGGLPFNSDFGREALPKVVVDVPVFNDEAELVLVLTPIFHIGAKRDDALAAYGVQMGVAKTPCRVQLEVPRGTYWLAVLALPKNKPPAVIASPADGNVFEISDNTGEIRLQLR